MKVLISNTDWGKSRWKMEIDLHAVCESEGKKEDVTEYGDNKRKYAVVYPVPKVKKLFKLMVLHLEPDVLNDVQSYLNKNSKGYGKVFSEIRQKNGR